MIVAVSNLPADKRNPKTAPTISAKSVDFNNTVLLGYDALGEVVGTRIPQALIIVGASGSGKSTLMRNITCASIRDSLTDTFLWDGKGGGDYAELVPTLRYAALRDAEHDPKAMREKASQLIDFASATAAESSARLLASGKTDMPPTTPGFNTMVSSLMRLNTSAKTCCAASRILLTSAARPTSKSSSHCKRSTALLLSFRLHLPRAGAAKSS